MLDKKDLPFTPLELSESEIIKAMQTLHGYIDITPSDFKEIYNVACDIAIKRFFKNITAKTLMTETLILLESTMALKQAASILSQNKVSGAPVVDSEKKVIGIVSEKDFLKEMGLGLNPSFMHIVAEWIQGTDSLVRNLGDRTVGDIMTTPPITGSPDMAIHDISTIFTQQNINRLPIVNQDKSIVGIVTRTDLAHAYHAFTKEQ